MTAATVAMLSATLLVSLVAGFVFAFAVVVMPGIRTMDDGDFIRAFQHMDGIIQRGDPLFGFVFVGSIVALLAALALGAGAVDGLDRTFLIASAVIYVGGVLVPTGTINVPLNNRLQRLEVDGMDAEERRAARLAFEPRWNRWNRIRTGLACVSAGLLAVVLVGL